MTERRVSYARELVRVFINLTAAILAGIGVFKGTGDPVDGFIASAVVSGFLEAMPRRAKECR